MRPIDADTLYMNLVKMKDFGELTAKKAIRTVENEPTIDAVQVIRCKDCKHSTAYYHGKHSALGMITYCCTQMLECNLKADDYCSRAERKEE